jgi:uncharacterized membrane protein YphA (DoxX/SURF4 family)
MRKLITCAITVNQSIFITDYFAMMWFQKGFAKMRIIETTKQYIAVDSIIANPTNSVLVIVGAASGCCAMELNADDTDLPSPMAGIIQPMPVVSPAVTIDATAMRVVLSIFIFFINCY